MTLALPGTIFEPISSEILLLMLARGGLKESGIGRENGIEALEACK
jgi:hypothetical protein